MRVELAARAVTELLRHSALGRFAFIPATRKLFFWDFDRENRHPAQISHLVILIRPMLENRGHRFVTAAGLSCLISMSDKQRNVADRERFLDLLATHEAQLLGFLCAIVPGFQDAEDVFQQTVLTMWQKFGDFELAPISLPGDAASGGTRR